MPNFHSFEKYPRITNQTQFSESVPIPPKSVSSYPLGRNCLAFFEIPGTLGRLPKNITYFNGKITTFNKRVGDIEDTADVQVHQSSDPKLLGTNIRVGSRNILVFHELTNPPNLN